MKRLIAFIPGINAFPGDLAGWTDRAASWTHIHTDARAEKCEYLAFPLTRRLFQQFRAGKIARMLERYFLSGKYSELDLVGHSNGCDIILRVLEQTFFHVNRVHLIAGACEADFEKNGLNDKLNTGRIGKVFVYWGDRDYAMDIAALTAPILGLFGFGYGTLGWHGPLNHIPGVIKRHRSDFNHSTWFKPEHFDSTMKMITA